MNLTEEQQAVMTRQIKRRQVHALVAHAWHSIAREKGYRFDAFLGTSSHGTLALVSYLRANNL